MKKSLILGLLSLCAAVTAKAQTTVGVHGSFIGTNFKYKAEALGIDLNTYSKTRTSFRAGVTAIVPVGETFAIIPQLNFVRAGTKLDGSTTFSEAGITAKISIKGSVEPNFLELPVHLGIAKTMDNGSRFFAGVGPSLHVGVSGRYKAETVTEATGEPVEKENVAGKIKFDGKKESEVNDDDPHFKRISFGGSAVAGYQFPMGLFIQAHYNLGLTSLSPDKDQTIKSNYAGIGIGYFLGGRRNSY